MKRVQLILEEWQHEWLSEEASNSGMTISALSRQLLREGIGRRQPAQRVDPISLRDFGATLSQLQIIDEPDEATLRKYWETQFSPPPVAVRLNAVEPALSY